MRRHPAQETTTAKTGETLKYYLKRILAWFPATSISQTQATFDM